MGHLSYKINTLLPLQRWTVNYLQSRKMVNIETQVLLDN